MAEEPQYQELRQYWEIDKDGKIIENYFWSEKNLEEGIKEGRIFVDTPWNEGMYEPRYNHTTKEWEEGKDASFILTTFKEMKKRELDQKCKEFIIQGFNHEINGILYHFSYDAEAQINFNDGSQVLNQGIITELMWTVYNPEGQYERIPINKELMNEITNTIILHKQGMISKYRDELLPQVEVATTLEEIENIVWK